MQVLTIFSNVFTLLMLFGIILSVPESFSQNISDTKNNITNSALENLQK